MDQRLFGKRINWLTSTVVLNREQPERLEIESARIRKFSRSILRERRDDGGY